MKSVERHEAIPPGLVTVTAQPAYLTDECWRLRTTGHPIPPRARCEGHCRYCLVSIGADMDVWRCTRCLNFLVSRVTDPELARQDEAGGFDGDGQGSLF